MDILIAALVLGVMGLVFGLVLTGTSKIFAVPSDPKRDAVREALPGANCGGCGYPGCDGCADAIAAGKAPANACPVCSAEAAAKIAEIMGAEVPDASNRKVARVLCQGDCQSAKQKFDYQGIEDCNAACTVNDGFKSCKFACMGLGTCVKACPFDAIHIDPEKKLPVVDEEKCAACGKCVAACPKGVLELQPQKQEVALLCRNTDKLKAVMDVCKVGCIGCQKCAKACKFEAITMVDNLPVIDLEKCRGCQLCAEACPTGAIKALKPRQVAEIDQNGCIGCTICAKNCKFGAIEGSLKQPHKVNAACTGCGVCAAKCPKKVITMKDAVAPRDPKAAVEAAPAKPAAETAKA